MCNGHHYVQTNTNSVINLDLRLTRCKVEINLYFYILSTFAQYVVQYGRDCAL